MYLDVEHRVRLEYDGFIQESHLELRLQPKTTPHQTLSSFVLAVGPPTKVHRYRDWHDNVVHHLAVTRFHDRIEVRSRSLVRTHPAAPGLASLDEPVPPPHPAWDLHDYLQLEGPLVRSSRLLAFHRTLDVSRQSPLGRQVQAIGTRVRERLEYRKEITRFDSSTDDFRKAGGGVCQDFTHLMLALLRLRRIPCRYVSGYLHVERSGEEPAQSHAWVEVHSAARGWVPFDPTHSREVDERYVVVAHGRHYDDVPPNRGIYRGGAQETLRAEVRTAVSAPKPISALHEEIRQIDLPVYQEIPARRVDRVPTPAEEAAAQQQ